MDAYASDWLQLIIRWVHLITGIAWIPTNPTRIISGSADGSLRIWDTATGKQLSRFDQGSPVTAVAVRPDGQAIASAGTAGTVRLWQTTDGKQLAELQGDLNADRLVVTRTEEQTIAQQHVATVMNWSFRPSRAHQTQVVPGGDEHASENGPPRCHQLAFCTTIRCPSSDGTASPRATRTRPIPPRPPRADHGTPPASRRCR